MCDTALLLDLANTMEHLYLYILIMAATLLVPFSDKDNSKEQKEIILAPSNFFTVREIKQCFIKKCLHPQSAIPIV